MKSYTNAIKIMIIAGGILFLSSCYTVQGAFQGAGEDTRSAANALHLNN